MEGSQAESLSLNEMEFDMEKELERQAEEKLERDVITEIDRYRRMDEWSSSFQNIYSRTALHCQLKLTKAKIMDLDLIHFLQYTRPGTFDMLRVEAFDCLVELDIFKTPELLKWFIFNMSSDSSAWIRHRLHCLFGRALASVAFGSDEPLNEPTKSEGLIIEQESTTDVRRADLARKQTMSGALEALKQELGQNIVLKEALWAASNSSCIDTYEISNFADLCRILYDAKVSVPVSLKYPRYWKCQHLERVSDSTSLKSLISIIILILPRVGCDSTNPIGSEYPSLLPKTPPEPQQQSQAQAQNASAKNSPCHPPVLASLSNNPNPVSTFIKTSTTSLLPRLLLLLLYHQRLFPLLNLTNRAN